MQLTAISYQRHFVSGCLCVRVIFTKSLWSWNLTNRLW